MIIVIIIMRSYIPVAIGSTLFTNVHMVVQPIRLESLAHSVCKRTLAPGLERMDRSRPRICVTHAAIATEILRPEL